MILKILLIIDYKSVVSIMLIIPEDVLFKHVMENNVYNMEVTVSLFDHQMGVVSIDFIGLITSADFNRLSIHLKLLIINFRISANSQPCTL